VYPRSNWEYVNVLLPAYTSINNPNLDSSSFFLLHSDVLAFPFCSLN
jgi:hypothetical protein